MPPYEVKSILEEQLKRGEQFAGAWPWRLLVFMLILFLVTIFIYAGMAFGYKPYLNSQLDVLDKKLADLNKQVESDQSKILITLYSQLVNAQSILDSHFMPSKLFKFLETNTEERVYYQILTLSLAEKTLKIEGTAGDYNALVRQAEYFRRAPEIKAVFLDDSRTREGGDIQFTLRLILDPGILK